jgi:hypothetical protein
MPSRVTMGFHRLGIVLAVPFVLAAVFLAVTEWKNTRTTSPALPRGVVLDKAPTGDPWDAAPDYRPPGAPTAECGDRLTRWPTDVRKQLVKCEAVPMAGKPDPKLIGYFSPHRVGVTIFPIAEGVVVGIGSDDGKYVRIRQDDGYETNYRKLSAVAAGIQAGKRVDPAKVIGYGGLDALQIELIFPSRPADDDPWADLAPWAGDPTAPPTGGRAPDYSMAMLVAAFGIGLYAVSRAIGWVLAGFAGR